MSKGIVVDRNTTVLVQGPHGQVSTNLGVLLQMAGATEGKRAAAKSVTKPTSTTDLARQIGKLGAALAPSVIVPAKQGKQHDSVTIYLTKELLPGDTSGQEYLCLTRTRRQDNGEVTPDDRMNFGFDKSWCFHRGAKGSTTTSTGEWKLKKTTRESGGVNGTFWARYIPLEDVSIMLEGLRANFAGATLIIDGKTSTL